MYSALALALLSTVSAQTFGLMTIRSGSSVQNSEVKLSSDGHLSLNGESTLTATFDNGEIKTTDGKLFDVYEGYLWAHDSGNGGWSIDGGHLSNGGDDGWVVCPNDNNNIKLQSSGGESPCDGAINVALRVIQTGGQGAAPASGDASSAASAPASAAPSSAAPAPASQDAAGSTDVVEQTVTETVCTHPTCQGTGVTPANGAAGKSAIIGGVAAAFAALL